MRDTVPSIFTVIFARTIHRTLVFLILHRIALVVLLLAFAKGNISTPTIKNNKADLRALIRKAQTMHKSMNAPLKVSHQDPASIKAIVASHKAKKIKGASII